MFQVRQFGVDICRKYVENTAAPDSWKFPYLDMYVSFLCDSIGKVIVSSEAND